MTTIKEYKAIKKVKHIFNCLMFIAKVEPKYAEWICDQIESMNFKNEYERKND